MLNRVVTGLGLTILLTVGSAVLGAKPAAHAVHFKKTQLDAKFRSEGVAVGDFNRDGKLDIAAGFVWYEAPDWKLHAILDKPPSHSRATVLLGTPLYYDPQKYANSFCDFAEDVNGDGWTDLIVVDFPGTPTWWLENPKGADGPWTQHLLTPVTNNESPLLVDLNGDGRRELVAGFSPDPRHPDGPERRMAYFTPASDANQPWAIHPISAKAAPGTRKYSHGLGVGDVNGDGRNDILCGSGWWEAPPSYAEGEWAFHAVSFGEKVKRSRFGETGSAAQMLVFDLDGDGDADVLASSPHAYGIWWHEQLPGGRWRAHQIDNRYSQTHAVCLVDINRDGLPDFVTGKRWWAHGGHDPGGKEPALLCWYQLTRRAGRPPWTRHQVDDDSGVGTQFEVADVNGDGLLDLVTSNKKGVYYFQQVRN